METALIFMGLLIFFAHVFNALFEKTKIPSVLILIIIGLVLGPILGLISVTDLGSAGSVFTTITLIAILYESGTDLRIADLGKTIGGASYLAIVNFVIALIIGLGIGVLILDMDVIPSLFLGAATGGSISATVVIPMLAQLKLGDKARDVMYLESALSDVVCLVVALAFFGTMQSGEELQVGFMIAKIFSSLIFAVIVGGIVGLAWMIIHRRFVANLKSTMFTTFALAFILYGICELIGINGGIAALAFGMMVGNMGEISLFLNKYIPSTMYLKSQKDAFLKHDERNFTAEIVFILQTYFYVYVGISMQLNNVTYILLGLLFIALVFLTRGPVVKVLGKNGYSKRDIKMMSILGPKGLVSAVLGSLPLQAAMNKGATGAELEQAQTIQGIAYAGILISIVVCSMFVFYHDSKGKKKTKEDADESVLGVNASENMGTQSNEEHHHFLGEEPNLDETTESRE